MLYRASLLHAAYVTRTGFVWLRDSCATRRGRTDYHITTTAKIQRARSIEDKDVAEEARRQFKASRDETDPLKIQMLVADATNYLEAMQGSTRGAGSSGDGNSWLDIDDPEDRRGRVGEGFPWQR